MIHEFGSFDGTSRIFIACAGWRLWQSRRILHRML